MAQRRQKKGGGEEDSSGSWALSYGDMMTLLLTFFILIVSFSTTELIKFRKAMGSLQGTTGVLFEQDGENIAKKEGSILEKPQRNKDEVIEALQGLEEEMFNMAAGERMAIEVGADGVNFRIDGEMLFDAGSASLRPDIASVLNRIGRIIQRFTCDVRIEGHSDNIPIRTAQFPSNWELSATRAASVARYFTDTMNLDESRFEVVGCGANDPLLPNITPENRKKNRRVEIFLQWQNVSNKLIF